MKKERSMDAKCSSIVWKIAAVVIVSSMIFARPQKKIPIDNWFCLVREPQGIVVEYKKAKKKHGDTCTAVWYHDSYGYKLYLKNGDSIRVCGSCVTGSKILHSGKKNTKKR